MQSSVLLGATAMLLAACGDPEPTWQRTTVTVVSPAVIGGEVTTGVEVASDLDVVSVEVTLDGVRVGASAVPPFAVTWSTLAIAEGEHQLAAHVVLGDRSTATRARYVTIDNTRPTIEQYALPARVTVGAPVTIGASDNNELAAVEVNVAGTTVAAAPWPWTVVWPGPCGAPTATVRVTDEAGWVTEASFTVAVDDSADADCDGHRSIAAGGDDCDDRDAATFAGAPDTGAVAIDRNCDGVPGIDGDGDGVATRATLGEDCDDAAASVHGAQLVWRRLPIGETRWYWTSGAAVARGAIGGSEVHVVAAAEDGLVHLAMNADGSGRIVRRLTDARTTGVAAVVDGDRLRVVYGRGSDVVLASWDGTSWRSEVIAAAGAEVRAVALYVAPDALHVAFVARDVEWMIRANGMWTRHVVVDHVDSDVAYQVSVSRGGVLYWTDRQGWKATLGPDGITRVEVVSQAVTRGKPVSGVAHVPYPEDPVVYGYQYDERAMFIDVPSRRGQFSVDGTVTAVFGADLPVFGPSIIAAFADAPLQVERYVEPFDQGGRHVLGGLVGIDTMSSAGPTVFASRDAVYVLDRAIAAATDVSDTDGIDADCDGRDW